MKTRKVRKKGSTMRALRRDISLWLFCVPGVVLTFIFSYIPMYGVQLAFRRYNAKAGIWGSPWVGFQHFVDFFNSRTCWELIRNTLMINLYGLVFGLPAPIIFALLLNEVKNSAFKRTIQTVSYLPYFISLVVACGMILEFTRQDGVVNDLIALFGGKRVSFMLDPDWFWPIYTITDIWQGLGWGSIIYIAAITNIDQGLYESAKLDGANRFQQVLHITLPGIKHVIAINLIMAIGGILNTNSDLILLLYTEATYNVADVIGTYTYRLGIVGGQYSYTTAAGLFMSVIGFILTYTANKVSNRLTGMGLW